MKPARAPRFLARQNYRRRRMIDAARLLPLLGVCLILVPILWQPAETAAPDTVRGGYYLFAVWTALIVSAAILARLLRTARATGPVDPAPTANKGAN
ncbi:MAG: hypothetical protein WBH14_05805 [Albidovulum sp.]